MGVLDELPTELLHQILGYLDWNAAADLNVARPDLLSASLTCWTLRHAAIPLIYRTVTLSLRWQNYVLAEPNLVQLRRRPHLAKHIRAVYMIVHPVRPQSRLSFNQDREREILSLPPASIDWLATEYGHGDQASLHEIALRQRHRDRVNYLAQLVCDSSCRRHRSAEQMITEDAQVSEEASFHSRSTALALVMLCFPRKTETIHIRCATTTTWDCPSTIFGMHVFGMALMLFGHQLQTIVTMLYKHVGGSFANLLHDDQFHLLGLPERLSTNIVDAAFVKQHVPSLKSLIVAECPPPSAHQDQWGVFDRWSGLSTTLQVLEVRRVGNYPRLLLAALQSFTSLRRLRLKDFVLYLPERDISQIVACVKLAIDLRKAMPHTRIQIEALRDHITDEVLLTADAEKWLHQEAIPAGTDIGASREEDLLRHCDAFLLLWEAEASIRGQQARDEWGRNDWRSNATRAKLVDTALATRSQNA